VPTRCLIGQQMVARRQWLEAKAEVSIFVRLAGDTTLVIETSSG
jgi:hypothetical protein